MYTFEAALSSIDDVKQFVDAANRCPCEVDVRAGRSAPPTARRVAEY